MTAGGKTHTIHKGGAVAVATIGLELVVRHFSVHFTFKAFWTVYREVLLVR